MRFEVDGCDLPGRGVPAAAVPAVLDSGHDLDLCPIPERPDPSEVELGFQRGDEQLAHRVVRADSGSRARLLYGWGL